MILFPAIDLKDGQCVRLKLGDMAQATVFNDDPAAQAMAMQLTMERLGKGGEPPGLRAARSVLAALQARPFQIQPPP